MAFEIVSVTLAHNLNVFRDGDKGIHSGFLIYDISWCLPFDSPSAVYYCCKSDL